jgi:CBS domain-containing protein
MKVASILRTKGSDITTAAADTTVADAARLLKEKRIGAVVISNDAKTVLGILSERDIIHALVDRGGAVLERPVSELMTRKVITCSPDDSISDLMAQMTERRVRHLPVICDGVMCGMVSIGDIVKNRIEEVETEASAMREYITSY